MIGFCNYMPMLPINLQINGFTLVLAARSLRERPNRFYGLKLAPESYIGRNSLGEKTWRENPLQYIVASGLRRP